MSISKDQVEQVNQVLKEALGKIQKIGDNSKAAEEVYQISLLSFPLTNKKDSHDEQ